MNDILIRNGRVLDPTTGLDCIGDLSIAKGKIREVGTVRDTEAIQTVDAAAAVNLPFCRKFRRFPMVLRL